LPVELSSFVQSLEAGIAAIPPAIIAIALLAGPTIVWVLYRYVAQPRTSRYGATEDGAYWICDNCRSANALRRSHCYRCGFAPSITADIQVIDSDVDAPEVTVSPGIPVGPGRPALAEAESHEAAEPVAVEPESEPVAVGPGRPVAAGPRRAVVVGHRPPPPEA
jgi:hypothetical protein